MPVLFGITLVAFFMLRLIPGDPAAMMLGTRAATQENIALVRHQLGLDQPLLVQYVNFLHGIVRGDLGQSFFYKQPVVALVLERVPVTIGLVLYASLISLCITFPVALLAALRKDQPIDHAIRALFLVTFGMPSFWVALMLMLSSRSAWAVSHLRQGPGVCSTTCASCFSSSSRRTRSPIAPRVSPTAPTWCR